MHALPPKVVRGKDGWVQRKPSLWSTPGLENMDANFASSVPSAQAASWCIKAMSPVRCIKRCIAWDRGEFKYPIKSVFGTNRLSRMAEKASFFLFLLSSAGVMSASAPPSMSKSISSQSRSLTESSSSSSTHMLMWVKMSCKSLSFKFPSDMICKARGSTWCNITPTWVPWTLWGNGGSIDLWWRPTWTSDSCQFLWLRIRTQTKINIITVLDIYIHKLHTCNCNAVLLCYWTYEHDRNNIIYI